MTFRDRTREFASVVQSMKTSYANGSSPSIHTSQRSSPLAQLSQFTQAARHIGHDLASTCGKLEKLTLLARKQSLFNDRGPEIQELTYIVKQDLGSLNKSIGHLQELTRSHGGRTTAQRNRHSTEVVMGLQTRLARLSNQFKVVLVDRTESLKKQSERREMFSAAPLPPTSASASHPGAMGNHTTPPGGRNGVVPSILLQDEERARRNTTVIDMNGDDSSAAHNDEVSEAGPVVGHRYQQQQMLIDETDNYLESRAETMQNIEHTIVELGEIFQQLAFMVKEQEEAVQRIDHNVDATSLNVEAAHTELLKFFQSVSSNRWLMFKVMGVLIVFFIIFVVLIA